MDDFFCVDDRFTLVAGGQTGADRAALDWAIEQGVRHGGWCSRGRRTEDGPLPDFYRLRETPGSGYLQRTEWNVRDSDATLVFTLSDKLDGGSKRTADFAERLGKPWLHVRPGVHPKFVARFLAQRQVTVLNVAGKRESSAPGIASLVRQVLAQALCGARERRRRRQPMVDRHVRLVVGAELGSVLERGFTSQAEAPALLYALADGRELMDAVRAGAWLATDARFAGEAALDAYALPLLHVFFDERRGRAPGTPEQEFGAALVANLQPAGSLFDRYLARLFANPGAALARSQGCQPYALALRSAELDMATPGAARRRRFALCSAIYDAAAQRAILDAAYTCFERYYVNGIERFGRRNAEQLLSACWDGFRRAAGELLPRFRPPSLAPEGEWIATSPLRAPEQFERVGNLLVPALALRSHKRGPPALPLEHTLVHETLPQSLAADGLRQFFRAHKLSARVSPA